MPVPELFSVRDRARLTERVLQLARSEDRVVAGAVIGSLALEQEDRWSDLDLTFAVADDQPRLAVLESWTRVLMAEFDAVQLLTCQRGVYLSGLLAARLLAIRSILHACIALCSHRSEVHWCSEPQSKSRTLNRHLHGNFLVTQTVRRLIKRRRQRGMTLRQG